MKSAELLIEAYGRVQQTVHEAVQGLTVEELAVRLDEGGNSIGWLVWHLTRVQDDHLAELADAEQVWTGEGWADRFALPFPPEATGYGHRRAEVAAVRVSGALLTGYYDAVHARSLDFLGGVSSGTLDRVIDERWNPPVTLAVRLVSVLSDDLQHIGQAALIRGVLLRRRPG